MRCALHPRASGAALGLFIYLGGMIHLGLRAGGAAERCSSVPAPRPGSRGPHPGHSSRVSREAPLLPGASGWGLGGWGAGALGGGGGGRAPSHSRSAPGWEATQRCPAQVRQQASFVKVLLRFPFLGEGEQKRSFFREILFLVCRY